jgi:hypothetical protein
MRRPCWLLLALLTSFAAYAQAPAWNVPITGNGVVSVTIGPNYRFVVNMTMQGAGTTTYIPIEGQNKSDSRVIGGNGRLTIRVDAYDGLGRKVIPHEVTCGVNYKRYSLSAATGGNACANFRDATISVQTN